MHVHERCDFEFVRNLSTLGRAVARPLQTFTVSGCWHSQMARSRCLDELLSQCICVSPNFFLHKPFAFCAPDGTHAPVQFVCFSCFAQYPLQLKPYFSIAGTSTL